MAQMSNRNPYPYPLNENDNTFRGGVYERVSNNERIQSYGLGEHLLKEKLPWNRLNKTPTLSSARREVYYFDAQEPRDSLDFVIKAEYDHHKEFLKNSAETVVQLETLGNPNGRVLKNRVVEIPKPAPALNHPLVVAEQKEKRSLHQAKGAISGHHAETTNRGYSRKPDGGYFG